MSLPAPRRNLFRLNKWLCRAGLLCCFVGVSAPVAHHLRAETPLRLDVIAGADAPPAALPQLSYFSEQDVALAVRLHGAAACPEIVARLVQLSYRLEAELLKKRAFDCAEIPGSIEAADLAFPFAVPMVDRLSRFEWRFFKCDEAGENCDVLLSLPFSAYPRDLLGPLKSWAANHVLVVRDYLGELQSFLDKNEIEFFERAVPDMPETEVRTLLVEREAPIGPADYEPYLAKGDVVLFREKIDTLPLINSVEIGRRRLTTVELVLISKLASGPAMQRLFLDILDLPRNQEPIQ